MIHLGLRFVAALGLLVLPLGAQDDRRFEDADLEELSARLAGYLASRTEGKDLETARMQLLQTFEALRLEAKGVDPLSLHADLARAYWLAREDEKSLRAGKVVTQSYEEGSFAEAPLEYAYRLPKGYEASGPGYPLILAVPDVDEKPADHIRDHWSLREFQEQCIVVSVAMPKDSVNWHRVAVSGAPGGLCHVLTALRLAEQRFALDEMRLFVAGRGEGVPAAVAAGNYAPQRFAGIVGRAGDAGEGGPANFVNLPTYFTGGGAQASAFQAAAKSAGHDNCLLQPDGDEGDVWSWLSEKRRAVYPERVTVAPGDPFPTRVSWLRISPIASDAKITGTLDKADNSVTLEGAGAARATLYLNDGLLDLGRPIKVFANGLEQEVRVERHLPTTLDLLHDQTSDAGCVYVARVHCKLGEGLPVLSTKAAEQHDPEYDEALAAALGDVQKLWSLHEWCLATDRVARSSACLHKLLRLDPDHAEARAALGHRRSGAQWFTNVEALERFERSQEENYAKARGHVLYKGLWMHPDERSLSGKGRIKDQETGEWLDLAAQRRLEDGWVRQDLEWIEPEDAHYVDDGLWKVDGEWLPLGEANLRRSETYSMWHRPGAAIRLHTTVDRQTASWAQSEMERALHDLQRVFGAEPVLPLDVAMLHDEEQYDRFAFGAPDGRRLATHAGRLHTIHSAFFAESWFPSDSGKPRYSGMGVCYWNADVPNGSAYGVHSARLATGLSYVGQLDPSPKAVRKALSSGAGGEYYARFVAEQKLPAWLRIGGAVYAERFFVDRFVAEDGNPNWARDWSLSNLQQLGGLRPLEELFAAELDPDDRDGSRKLMIEFGLLVAFLVDGECAPATAAHEAFKAQMIAGRLHGNHLEALAEALLENEGDLRAFAGE